MPSWVKADVWGHDLHSLYTVFPGFNQHSPFSHTDLERTASSQLCISLWTAPNHHATFLLYIQHTRLWQLLTCLICNQLPTLQTSPQDSTFHFVSIRSSIMIKMPIFSTGRFLLGQVTILEVQAVCTALIDMYKAKRSNQRKKGQRRYNRMNLTKGKLMETDWKKQLLEQGGVQEKVTDFPLLETIKGSLDRVLEGIIALSFCIHHMPNNYCRTGLLLQNYFCIYCFADTSAAQGSCVLFT